MSKSNSEAQFRLIPVSDLALSPLNVRQTGSESGIEQLSKLILAEGVLQNLNVHELKDSDRSRYGVIAGGRRLRALQLLIKAKHIKADYPAPCMLVSIERALQISLTENSGREPMHPADEFEAFRQLVDAGQPIEDVAARFGVSPMVVRRRLKLANVSPTLVSAYRADELSLETLMAFAVSDDHERQEQLFASLKDWQLRPDTVRDRLTENEITLKDPLARFVGLKAYEKAGGSVKRDLFAGDNDALLDAGLIQQLAQAKLEKQAATLKAEGAAWVDVHPKLDYEIRARYGHVKTKYREPTPEEQATIDSLEKQIDALQAIQDESDDEAVEAAEQDWDKANDELDQLRESFAMPDPEQQALAGVLISIGHDGKIEIERDMLKSEDALRFSRARKSEARSNEDGEPPLHSAALTRRLTAQRTVALQAEVAQQPQVALLALVHKLALSTFFSGSHFDSILRLTSDRTTLSQHAEELEGTRAKASLEAHRARIEALLPKEPESLLTWLSTQPHEVLMDILAFCVAQSLDAVQSSESPSAFDPLATLAKFDMRRWWDPTAGNYFDSLPRVRILAVVTEAKSEAAAATLSNLKKGALAIEAEKQLSATRWVPNVMRAIA